MDVSVNGDQPIFIFTLSEEKKQDLCNIQVEDECRTRHKTEHKKHVSSYIDRVIWHTRLMLLRAASRSIHYSRVRFISNRHALIVHLRLHSD